MKRFISITIILFISILLIGCGKKSQDDIVNSLGEKVESVSKFNVDAVMEIKDNNKTHVFDVNVKYQSPELYKVTLKNRDSNNVQIILKNKDGVFVLNPSLNKSFKFQSDWPSNSSQPYLFQSLVKDILNDSDAIFVKQGSDFVFETKVDYLKSKDLVSQKIIINGKTLFPKEVIVYDATNAERIKVLFGDVDYKPSFKEAEFEVEASMSTVKQEYSDVLPTFSEEREFLYPTYVMAGTEIEPVTSTFDSGKRAIMTFNGDSSFTLVQEYVNVGEESKTEIVSGEADIVILASGVGFVQDNSLTWFNDGLSFRIVSTTIDNETYSVANSMMGESGK